MIEFQIPGPAVPQGSARAFVGKNSGRPIITTDSTGLAQWRYHAVRCIHQVVEDEGVVPLAGPVGVSFVEYRKRPPSRPKKHLWPDRRPDIDKVARALLDALEASGLIGSDSQVCYLEACKSYRAVEGMEVRVWAIEEIGPD